MYFLIVQYVHLNFGKLPNTVLQVQKFSFSECYNYAFSQRKAIFSVANINKNVVFLSKAFCISYRTLTYVQQISITFYFTIVSLKGQCHEIFFSHESDSPQPQSIPSGPFQIFSKIRRDTRKSRYTTGINDTGGKFGTGVNDAGGKLPPVSTTPAANLLPGVDDTGGKQWEQLSDS